jgi:hypothetical protein
MATRLARAVDPKRVADLIAREEEAFRRARPRSVELWKSLTNLCTSWSGSAQSKLPSSSAT